MCSMPSCTTVPQTQKVDTAIPGTRPVLLTYCPDCDTRSCGTTVGTNAKGEQIKCSDRIKDPRARKCPSGHVL